MNPAFPSLEFLRHSIIEPALRFRIFILAFVAAGLVSDNSKAVADDYYDIGDFQCKVTTESDEAQTWFNRGLAMCHAFNHGEGARCFQKALSRLFPESPGRLSATAFWCPMWF